MVDDGTFVTLCVLIHKPNDAFGFHFTACCIMIGEISDVLNGHFARSSTAPLLDKPFIRTDFANRAFRCSAPTVWNSLPETIIIRCDSLSRFKFKLKTYFFDKAFD